MSESHDARKRGLRLLATASVASGLFLGVGLRWGMAGELHLPLPFDHFRHAHSHTGYFGVLFPLAWLGWAACGIAPLGRRSLAL